LPRNLRLAVDDETRELLLDHDLRRLLVQAHRNDRIGPQTRDQNQLVVRPGAIRLDHVLLVVVDRRAGSRGQSSDSLVYAQWLPSKSFSAAQVSLL
jgi:hypothetical protein